MATKSKQYSDDELNYFRVCCVATNILPRALRTVFKQEWDTRYKTSHGQWLNTAKNASDFYNGESGANQKRLDREPLITVKNGNSEEWDCTCCFFAILNSTSIGAIISHTVESSVKDLRDFRNKSFAHASEGKISDKEFQASIQLVIDSFKTLGICTDVIQDIKTETTFSTEETKSLQKQLKKEQENVRQLGEQAVLLEEHVKALEEEIAEPVSFCSLPPDPSHETVNRLNEVRRILQEMENVKGDSVEGEDVTVLYLSGNPGCGKSQVARQVGESFYRENQGTNSFVMTLDAKNMDTVLESYTKFAHSVGCTEYAVSKTTSPDNKDNKYLNQQERLGLLKSLIIPKVRQYSQWLIIVDNVTDIKLVSQYWPQPGTKEWGHGQVLVTTQDSHSIPSAHSRSHHISLSRGMEPREAAALLSKISSVTSGDDKEQEVAWKLDYQPLALACAALYVKSTEISWQQYIMKLKEGKREATEEVYESTNLTYTTAMTTAVMLAIEREVECHVVLHHAFQYLSLLAPEKMPLKYVVRYVLNRLPEADEHVVQAKILQSSLVLLVNAKAKEIRVHQVVHNIIKSKFSTLTTADEACATAAILSFKSLVGYTRNDLDLIKSGRMLVPHFCYLLHTVRSLGLTTKPDMLSRESTKELTDVANCILVIGEACEIEGQLEKAKEYHQLALIIRKTLNGNDHIDVADSFICLGRVYNELGHREEARDYLRRALAISQSVFDSDSPYVASCLGHLGQVYDNLGKHAEARYYYQRALTIYQAAYGNDHPAVASILSNLGGAYGKLGQYAEAKVYLERALTIDQALYDKNHPELATSLSNLGHVCNELGRYEEAKDYHQRALNIRQAVYGDTHKDVATSFNNLGLVCEDLGKHEEAKEYYQRALAIYQALYDSNHPDVVTSLRTLGPVPGYRQLALIVKQTLHGNDHIDVADNFICLGRVYNELGQHEEAREYLQQALAISQAVFDSNNPHVASCLGHLGQVYDSLGKHAEARGYYQRALIIYQAAYGNDHREVAACLTHVGDTYGEVGRYEEARHYHERALVIYQALYESTHPDVAAGLANLGKVYYGLRQYEKAKEYHQQALAIRQTLYDDDHPYVTNCLERPRRVCRDLDQHEEAKAYRRRMLAIYPEQNASSSKHKTRGNERLSCCCLQ